MRCLIAGAGDLGMRCAAALRVAGQDVYALRRSTLPATDSIHPIAGDITRAESLDALPAVDSVLFCPTPDARDREGYHKVFVDGLMNVLDRCQPNYLLFVSSTAVYGQTDGSWVDETSSTTPTRFNGQVLLQAEAIAADAGGGVLRLAGIYGPGRDALLRSVKAGKPAKRDYWTNRIHVHDAARAAAMLLTGNVRQVINGVDELPAQDQEVRAYLAEAMGVEPVEPIAYGSCNKRVSAARLRSLGFHANYPSYREGYAELLP